jgi:putative peptidoglycan lipid II flippase
MLGQSVVALDETFMSVFGAMVGEGAGTALQYARRTMFVPVGVIAQAAAVAAYPTLARLFAEGNRAALLSTVDKALRYVLVLSIGAMGIAMAMSLPIVTLLFERGAFDQNDSADAASALFMYALAIPVWGALQIVTRAFYSRRQMWTPVIVGSAMTVVAIPTYFILQANFGIEGVALGSVIALTAYTAALTAIWYRPADARAGLRSVLRSAGRVIPLAVPAGICAFGASWLVTNRLLAPSGVTALLSLVVGIAVYATVAIGLGSWLYDALWRRIRGRTESATP